MSKIKKYFIVTMVSTGIGTTLSAIIYLLFGRGSFNLLHLFSVQLENPIYNATVAILIYWAFGITVFSANELFQDVKDHKLYHIMLNFFLNVTIFSLLAMLSIYPIGEPLDQMKNLYINQVGLNSFMFHFIIVPITESFVIYLVVYTSLWLAYRQQVRKLNKALKAKKS